MKANEFILNTLESGLTFTWVITADSNRLDHILYYPHVAINLREQRCPYIPLHKDRIKNIEQLRQVTFCYPTTFPNTPIYIARVELQPLTDANDSDLLGAFTALSHQEANLGLTFSLTEGTVRLRFKNSSVSSKIWTVEDKISGNTVLDEHVFEGKEIYPSEDGDDWVYLQATSTGYGEIRYKHSEQTSWSNKSFLDDQDIYELY